MTFSANQIYHIYNQGNNREPIFFQDRNYHFFLEKMRKHLLPYVELICYCLMPNHFHWLVLTKPEACLLSKAVKPVRACHSHHLTLPPEHFHQQNLSNAIAILLRSYTRAINNQENRSGSLFRKQTKMKQPSIPHHSNQEHSHFLGHMDYAMQCFYYIHQNPVKAGLVKIPTDWPYSSAREYAGMPGKGLCTCTYFQVLTSNAQINELL